MNGNTVFQTQSIFERTGAFDSKSPVFSQRSLFVPDADADYVAMKRKRVTQFIPTVPKAFVVPGDLSGDEQKLFDAVHGDEHSWPTDKLRGAAHAYNQARLVDAGSAHAVSVYDHPVQRNKLVYEMVKQGWTGDPNEPIPFTDEAHIDAHNSMLNNTSDFSTADIKRAVAIYNRKHPRSQHISGVPTRAHGEESKDGGDDSERSELLRALVRRGVDTDEKMKRLIASVKADEADDEFFRTMGRYSRKGAFSKSELTALRNHWKERGKSGKPDDDDEM